VALGFGAVPGFQTGNGIEGDPNSTNFFGLCARIDDHCSASKGFERLHAGLQGEPDAVDAFGVGADVTLQPETGLCCFPLPQSNWAGESAVACNVYDFDAIVQPVKAKRASLELLGGIGGANLKFTRAVQLRTPFLGTQNFSQVYGSSITFKLHGGAGVNIFVKDNIFIRPQFDLHYVPNLNQSAPMP